MIKKTALLLFLLFLSSQLFAQEFKFAWLSDTHAYTQEAYDNIRKIVADINKKDFKFVLISGDITGAGANSDLENAKRIFDSLKIKYYIVPGNHDTKRSESCCTKFSELWGDDKFTFDYEGVKFIGFNTGISFRGHGGHVAPETLKWIETILAKTDKNQPVIFVMHHLLDNMLDNWFELTNRIRNHNVIALLCGHGHKNVNTVFNGVPAVMSRSTMTNKNGWGYCSIDYSKDSLLVYEENGGAKQTKLGAVQKVKRNVIPAIDSVQFVNYGSKIVANMDVNKTLNSGLAVSAKYIAAASKDGILYCFNTKGKKLWEYDTKDAILGNPAISKDILVAGTVHGNLFAIDCKTGKLIKETKINDLISSRLVAGEINNGDKKIDAVFAGTTFGALYCVDAKTLNVIWKNTDGKGLIEDEPLIYNGKIFYGAWDAYLNCCDISSGKTEWRWQGSDKFYYSPAACKPVTDGTNVYIATPDNFVSAVSISTGKTTWRSNEPNCWESLGISSDNKQLYVKDISNKLNFVSVTDGKVIKSLEYKNKSENMCSEIIECNGSVLFSSQNGTVYKVYNNVLSPVMFLGTSRSHAVKKISGNTFAVSNMDGRIVVFELK